MRITYSVCDIISCVYSMPKRSIIDAPASETAHPVKRRKGDECKDSGGCMAYVLWKMGIFDKCGLSDVKEALNSEIGAVFQSFNFMRRKQGRVHHPCTH
jgi:hypothetical protein